MSENRAYGKILVGVAAAALCCSGSEARASLAPSELEQVRHEVATVQNVAHVRALIARPDLTSEETAVAMASAMSSTPVDEAHAAYLHELVFGSASAAPRPIVAVAVVHGLLARANTLLDRGPDVARTRSAVDELGRAYALIEEIVSADPKDNITDTARADCATALAEHFARNGTLLHPGEAAPLPLANARAQAAIALLDATPDSPERRVDAANALALLGARRAALIELGLLVLDSGGSDARVAAVRPMIERLPGARDGAEAIVVGDADASKLRARGGAVIAIDASSPQAVARGRSPWGSEVAPPSMDEATLSLVHDLASAAVRRALALRPQLRAAVEQDGGEAGVANMAAMLEVDPERTLDAAAARLLAGKGESVAWLSDALGALAVFSAPAKGADGLTVNLGGAGAAGGGKRATRVSLDASGAATALRIDTHTWRIARDGKGAVTGLSRDSAPVTAKMVPNAPVAPHEATSWTGEGLVFARLAGSPRASVAPGPHVSVYGSGLYDAIASPAPADDVVAEADLRVQGGPAGMVVRAVPGSSRAFKGLSVMVIPGTPSRAALLLGDGAGTETAAAPVVDIASTPQQHVRITVKGQTVQAKVGSATLEASLPPGFEHGDVALRAYPGASVEATGWKVKKQ
ncbi:MAG TPA: hypothetical protein VGM06_15155 [Polyangiaceae bacterium]